MNELKKIYKIDKAINKIKEKSHTMIFTGGKDAFFQLSAFCIYFAFVFFQYDFWFSHLLILDEKSLDPGTTHVSFFFVTAYLLVVLFNLIIFLMTSFISEKISNKIMYVFFQEKKHSPNWDKCFISLSFCYCMFSFIKGFFIDLNTFIIKKDSKNKEELLFQQNEIINRITENNDILRELIESEKTEIELEAYQKHIMPIINNKVKNQKNTLTAEELLFLQSQNKNIQLNEIIND